MVNLKIREFWEPNRIENRHYPASGKHDHHEASIIQKRYSPWAVQRSSLSKVNQWSTSSIIAISAYIRAAALQNMWRGWARSARYLYWRHFALLWDRLWALFARLLREFREHLYLLRKHFSSCTPWKFRKIFTFFAEPVSCPLGLKFFLAVQAGTFCGGCVDGLFFEE